MYSSMEFVQWHPDYPTIHTSKGDITTGTGFVFDEDNVLLGYCCIIIGDEPAYHIIGGAWKTDSSYAVVHRMVFSRQSRGKGLSGSAFSLIKRLFHQSSKETSAPLISVAVIPTLC